MIVLVSFPRSGNTFFRNLLYELYGLESSTFHREEGRDLDANWASFPVVKTHLMPKHLPPELQGRKVVYIVRDGRDALVSIAHHRKDIIEPGTDFYNNLLQATIAAEGSYFGGWSENVAAWTARADLVIRYEDLIKDPIRETERLRDIIDLPAPNREKLPTFEDLKFGQPKYGAGSGNQFDPKILKKNFRKGKSGSWKEEMPLEIQRLFWHLHGRQMNILAYKDGQLPPVHKEGKYKILIEVSKLFTQDNDGIKRYLVDLLFHLNDLLDLMPAWKIDLFYHGQPIQPLRIVDGQVFVVEEKKESYEEGLLAFKARIRAFLPSGLYTILSFLYRMGPFRKLLSWFRELVIRNKQNKAPGFKHQLEQYDLVHLPLPQHLPFMPVVSTPKLITIHDCTHRLFPQFHTSENIRLAEKGMQLALTEESTRFLSVSRATANDLEELYPTTIGKNRCIHEGVSGRFDRRNNEGDFSAVRSTYALPEEGSYFLSLSTIEPRKNIRRIISAFLRFREKQEDSTVYLFICGKKGWLSDDVFVDEADLREKGIFFTGFVEEEHLTAFYRNALALCYVSLYEGFGLPLLESMQCGRPVIFGDNSSMPEVVGDGGIGVNAESIAEIADAMHKLATDSEYREHLAEVAWRQANTFSPLKTAYQTLLYYEDIITQQA